MFNVLRDTCWCHYRAIYRRNTAFEWKDAICTFPCFARLCRSSSYVRREKSFFWFLTFSITFLLKTIKIDSCMSKLQQAKDVNFFEAQCISGDKAWILMNCNHCLCWNNLMLYIIDIVPLSYALCIPDYCCWPVLLPICYYNFYGS